jgi:hypothetical protein
MSASTIPVAGDAFEDIGEGGRRLDAPILQVSITVRMAAAR